MSRYWKISDLSLKFEYSTFKLLKSMQFNFKKFSFLIFYPMVLLIMILGPCPTCPKNTLVRCRCGYMDKEIPCCELTGRPDDARCEKRCQKKRSCGRHKCTQLCCIEIEHECNLICGKLLTCALHR